MNSYYQIFFLTESYYLLKCYAKTLKKLYILKSKHI